MKDDNDSLSIAQKLAYTTVRLECMKIDGSKSIGTGFFYKCAEDGDRHVPVIFTNKHVVRGASVGRFLLNLEDSNGKPMIGNSVPVELNNFESRWYFHPDDNIDLCAMPIAPLKREAESLGKTLYYVMIEKQLIPSLEIQESFDLLEEIIMVGYPIGLWDQVNNLPIFRKGMTATHVALNWNGKREFVIDAACFPGSSGSPVFAYNRGVYTNKKGQIVMGSRLYLLGVLWGGPIYDATGEIKAIPIPTSIGAQVVTTIPTNLGFVLSSTVIQDIDTYYRNHLEEQKRGQDGA
ncbi:MAG TPA: serine protease [Candidatus Cloacimonadota bacterium]|nr:serine protease [Candidatus Cloacimonadota bacterium]